MKVEAAKIMVAALKNDIQSAQAHLTQELTEGASLREVNQSLSMQNTQLQKGVIFCQNDLKRVQTDLVEERTQLKGLRETHYSLLRQNTQVHQDLVLCRKQVAAYASNSESHTLNSALKADTIHANKALIPFAGQVLKFLADTVSYLEAVPHHADEHYRKEYLLELEEGSKLLTDDIAEIYHESTQRLFTYWTPIIQAYILSGNTEKKALLPAKQQIKTLQAQLINVTNVAADSNKAKLKALQDLEAFRKEAEHAKTALSNKLTSRMLVIKQDYEENTTALATAYATRRQNTFFETAITDKFKYNCLLPYLPTRVQATDEQQQNRERVWRFKDGQNTHEVAYLISIALLKSYTPLQLESMTLVVIPASTAAKNRLRYEKFCAYVSKYTGLTNGFECITVAQDREALKGSTSTNKVSNLVYNRVCIKGRHILLFDDVMTTGGSFTQNAARLVENGATDVTGVFLARTQRV